MAINRQKLKLLYLMRMLEEETDAERGLTMAQIIGKLEALGISAERKSIYRDIEALREFGLDVRTLSRQPVEYAVVGAPRVRVRRAAAAGGRGAELPLPHAA